MILTPQTVDFARIEVLLSTMVSSYAHSAFGLRYLYSNLAELRERALIAEFTIQQNPRNVVEDILRIKPKIVGFGVYIWNARQLRDVVSTLKRVSPETVVVLGGPEVSFEIWDQEICRMADYVVAGEGDFAFRDLCRRLLADGEVGRSVGSPGMPQILEVKDLPEVSQLESPYQFYSQHDVENRVVYVEASRGCPFKCEYCLSALDKQVRNFPQDKFLRDLDQLIGRGARRFKFIDRTFNLSIPISRRILEFFLDRAHLGLFLHFEMIPDRLPLELREVIAKFPAGVLQFEIGIQTWNQEVAQRVSRRQNYDKIRENFEFLTRETHVHIHADLIAGLPGESLESFGRGFDEVMTLNSPEIQLGMLKRLRGAPIARHEERWGMVFQSEPPYAVLATSSIPFADVQKMSRLARFWELLANSGNFQDTLKIFCDVARGRGSVFWGFWEMSEWLSVKFPEAHSISLPRLSEAFFDFLTGVWRQAPEAVALTIGLDYMRDGRKDPPEFLRKRNLWKSTPRRLSNGSANEFIFAKDQTSEVSSMTGAPVGAPTKSAALPRQRRHHQPTRVPKRTVPLPQTDSSMRSHD